MDGWSVRGSFRVEPIHRQSSLRFSCRSHSFPKCLPACLRISVLIGVQLFCLLWCVCVRARFRVYVHVCVRIHMQIYLCVCALPCVCMCICINMHVFPKKCVYLIHGDPTIFRHVSLSVCLSVVVRSEAFLLPCLSAACHCILNTSSAGPAQMQSGGGGLGC